jgi:hypothetical protein
MACNVEFSATNAPAITVESSADGGFFWFNENITYAGLAPASGSEANVATLKIGTC